ncbi:alpha-amylase family glycosyl hydrolase [Marinifilum sp. D737]|jgi:glycosidase|uniref:alpha-amylase family glycosyl hydrolase n=1 Tax=Marinifilum sp. D737 TaxID=2969628 RepID=UPI00227678E6|nr:alpha-amylase family glycosyl hydrolase [Marinifilum sp. D737]MCY1633783.1 alpha-amylase family glycosyl hydrolase [Marinifilum sp. D737]
MKRIYQTVLSFLVLAGILVGCQNKPATKTVKAEKPLEWSRNANIYEVNIRQHTKEGTFNAFADHLPRLKEMGVDILWLMPIFPISEKNRKGSLGSYYSVKDYRAVSPEYGTMEDFKNLVKKAHDLGMYVILDWVANHTGWDNHLITEHADWYTHNEKGEIVSPVEDWSDTADLNFDNEELRKYMIGSLKFWIEQADVDGYRCDMAAMVPTDFWNRARKELDAVKPVFMLAEAWEPELVEEAFDMAYGWDFHHLMNHIAKGEKNAKEIDAYFAKVDTLYPKDAYIMNFLTNHDENSWAGTIKERMGDAGNTFAVLTFTMPGMPMLYSGQEAGLDHRLKFFEKDEINWDNKELMPFYTQLISLKKNNKALRNGAQGGQLVRIPSDKDEAVYAFVREKDGDKILVVLNLTGEAQDVNLNSELLAGEYKEYFTNEAAKFAAKEKMSLKAWEYKVFVK